MKRCLLSLLCALLLLPLCARGDETDLQAASASEGRIVMEEGLEALGIAIAPYEITDEDWNRRGLTRYQMYAESSPYSTHQLVDGQDRLMDSALFFSPWRATEAEIAWAEEHLREVWALTLRTVYPGLSDAQAEELVARMVSTLAKETLEKGPFYNESGLPHGRAEDLIHGMDETRLNEAFGISSQLRGGARLGDYAFSLVLEEEGGLDSYLQIMYLGE